MDKKRPVICMTGGHLTPAVAVIERIREDHKAWNVVFIGRRFAMEGDKHDSIEYRFMTNARIPFYSLSTGRIQRWISLGAIVSLVKIPYGCLQALWILSTIRPNLIVSFGGYVAVPVVLAGWILGIPSITHEQTGIMGLGNRLISVVAKIVMVSDEKLIEPDNSKIVYTGLPLRKALFDPPKAPSFPIKNNSPVLYITGGSTGAQSLNKYIYGCLPSLVKDFTIIHQTGERSFGRANVMKHTLPDQLKRRYIIKPFFDVKDLAWIYAHAILIVGRAGANTVGEIAALGSVGLFIPLPWSGNAEQQQNAETLVQQGSSDVIAQGEVTSQKIEKEIRRMILHIARYRNNAMAHKKNIPLDAAGNIVAIIENSITPRS